MTPIAVEVWIDPACPWAWQTSVWLRRLADADRVRLDWRLFSLELNASEPQTPFRKACARYGEALLALALARREGGNEAFERLYVALARRLHDEKLEPSAEIFRSAAAEVGLDDVVDRAVATHDLDEEITGEYLAARGEDVFGVPTLRIGDTKVVYGPIIALAPEGEAAERLWEHTRWMAERPDFFELKRWPRDVRPGETPRTVA